MSIDRADTKTFIISVTARSLFDMEDSHKIYQQQGIDAFEEYERKHEWDILKPGRAFGLVKKLLEINATLPEGIPKFEVVLVSKHSTDTAMRVLHSLDHYKMNIVRAAFTGGAPTANYVKAFNTELFLTSNLESARSAISAGIPAAYLPAGPSKTNAHSQDIRIAFDGDAVLFSDEAERTHAEGGLAEFQKREYENQHSPLPEGPFYKFLQFLHVIQDAYKKINQPAPVRTALVTARSMPAHLRAIRTLKGWGIGVDEAHFLGGRDKTPILEAFRADIFFDDSKRNIELAQDSVLSGHVPYGIRNENGADESHFTGGNVTKSAPAAGTLPSPTVADAISGVADGWEPQPSDAPSKPKKSPRAGR